MIVELAEVVFGQLEGELVMSASLGSRAGFVL